MNVRPTRLLSVFLCEKYFTLRERSEYRMKEKKNLKITYHFHRTHHQHPSD